MIKQRCLCYDSGKGFYTKLFYEGDDSTEILIKPYYQKGRKSTVIKTPDGINRIILKTYFTSWSTAYHKAEVFHKENRLLDFDINTLPVLNNVSTMTFCTPQQDWDLLFGKIIDSYNLYQSGKIAEKAYVFIDAISSMLNSNSIYVKGAFHQKKTTEWDKELLITLHSGRKIKDLLEGILISPIEDKELSTRINGLINAFLVKIKKQSFDFNDSRIGQISDALFSIHKYMYVSSDKNSFLKYCLEK